MSDRTILGLTEVVVLIGNNKKEEELTARIDTGATSSSIDLALAESLHLGPIIRSRTIKSVHGAWKRPSIKAMININGLLMEAEFTLADRSRMTYQILIGQNILKQGNFLIDPRKEEKK